MAEGERLECRGCGKRVGCHEEKLDVVAISETGLCSKCLDSYTNIVGDCKWLEANGGPCISCYAWKELGDERPHCYERWVGSFECAVCCREVDETTKTTRRFFYGPEENAVQICSKCYEKLSKLEGLGDSLRIQVVREPSEGDCRGRIL